MDCSPTGTAALLMTVMGGRLGWRATPNGHSGLWFQRIPFLLSASLPPPVAEMQIGSLASAVEPTTKSSLGGPSEFEHAESNGDAGDFPQVGDLDMYSGWTCYCSHQLFCGDGRLRLCTKVYYTGAYPMSQNGPKGKPPPRILD